MKINAPDWQPHTAFRRHGHRLSCYLIELLAAVLRHDGDTAASEITVQREDAAWGLDADWDYDPDDEDPDEQASKSDWEEFHDLLDRVQDHLACGRWLDAEMEITGLMYRASPEDIDRAYVAAVPEVGRRRQALAEGLLPL